MATEIEQALAWCLEAIEKGRLTPRECRGRFPEHDPELTELLDLATALRAMPQGMASIGFRLRARSRLQLLIRERNLRPAPQSLPLRPASQPARSRLSSRARSWAAALSAAALLLTSTSTAMAAADSLPGDLLYPAKLLVELAQESLTTDPVHQAALHLRLAERRMQEIADLIEAGRTGDLDQALANMELHLALAGMPAEGESSIPAGFAHHIDVLRGLLERLPAQARPAIERALVRAETALQAGGPGRSADAPGLQADGADSAPPDTPPGLTDDLGNRPDTPPGQSGEAGPPATPPGQSGEHGPPDAPPGQSGNSNRPETPPGQSKKP